MLKRIETEKAPGAVGPYSQGISVENIIFTSGQLPIDPKTGELETKDIKKATRLCLNNVKAVVEAAGGEINSIAKVNVYVKDMDDFAKINEEYALFFNGHKPARALVEVARLPKDANIEIEAIALI